MKMPYGIGVLCLSVFAALALLGFSSPADEKSEKLFYAKDFGSDNVIGALGYPMGTVVRITGKSLGKDQSRSKALEGVTWLEIETVNGKKLERSIKRFHYRGISGMYSKVASPVLEKGEPFDFYVYETCGYHGLVDIPKELDHELTAHVAGVPFSFDISLHFLKDNRPKTPPRAVPQK
ncbi:MAG: hypothetical protein U0894_00345 [Pirellulales bacterium]